MSISSIWSDGAEQTKREAEREKGSSEKKAKKLEKIEKRSDEKNGRRSTHIREGGGGSITRNKKGKNTKKRRVENGKKKNVRSLVVSSTLSLMYSAAYWLNLFFSLCAGRTPPLGGETSRGAGSSSLLISRPLPDVNLRLFLFEKTLNASHFITIIKHRYTCCWERERERGREIYFFCGRKGHHLYPPDHNVRWR